MVNWFTRRRILQAFKILCPGIIALCSTASAIPAKAGGFSQFVSDEGTILYVGTGVALPLLLDGKNGKQHSLRALDSLGTSLILCEGLKQITQVKRPDSSSRDSFPSCHATAAFAIAAMESRYHPDYAPLWYAGATLIGYSRVDLNRHRVSEVLAGAALGYLTSRLELSQKHGLILFPLITNDSKGSTVVGLQVMSSF